MRQPVLFDEKLIERNLEFYTRKFTKISRQRLWWIRNSVAEVMQLACINVAFSLRPTLDLINTHHFRDATEDVKALEENTSFTVYRHESTKVYDVIRAKHAYIDNDASPFYHRIEYPFEPNNGGFGYLLCLSQSRNVNYNRYGLICKHTKLSNRQANKLNPDITTIRGLRPGITCQQIQAEMDYLLLQNYGYGKPYQWVSATLNNEFSSRMLECFVSTQKKA